MQAGDSITAVRGVGARTAALYQKLGVYTVGDLLNDYPRAYERYEEPVTIREAAERDFAAVRVVPVSAPVLVRSGRIPFVTVRLTDREGGRMSAIWFRADWVRRSIRKGDDLVLRGRLTARGNTKVLTQPKIFTAEAYAEKTKTLQPVYALTPGITAQTIAKQIRQVLDEGVVLPETIPQPVREKYRLMGKNEAVRQIHFPEEADSFPEARRRLVFEEFWDFLTAVRRLKAELAREKNHFALVPRPETDRLIERLPYRLTGAQLRTWKEIEKDLTGPGMMHRMVQGDVGSGKTIVAFLAMILTGLCHYQSVLMAPTEVLAVQHYQKLEKLLADSGIALKTVLLTGSQTAEARRETLRQIRSHEADLIVGTHAVFQQKVEYDELALVITDEQHRFGVRQRDQLSGKGHTPHVLVMSATPIPRSLAMILYGDLDISLIDEMPAGRTPIHSAVISGKDRPKAWSFLKKQLAEGHQAYVICPMIEQSDEMPGQDVLSCSEKLAEYLQGGARVGVVHGRMPDADKEAAMARFAAGEIQVLVSTTVIEVGIDVPNATLIIIEDAGRFGLAQLHQLRGRVGRGRAESYCIFIDSSGNPETLKRLKIVADTRDGFEIAAQDLKMRGPGDFFGERQSGDLAFKLADVYADAETLRQAAEAVKDAEAGGLLPEETGNSPEWTGTNRDQAGNPEG